MGVAAVDRKKSVWAKTTYGVFLLHTAMGRLMRWVLDGRVYGFCKDVQRIYKRLLDCEWEIGAGLSVGSGEGLTSGQSCQLAVAGFAGLFVGA